MKTFDEYLKEKPVNEEKFRWRTFLKRMYRIQDEIDKLENDLVDYEDKGFKNPRKKAFYKALADFKKELEALKTDARKNQE